MGYLFNQLTNQRLSVHRFNKQTNQRLNKKRCQKI